MFRFSLLRKQDNTFTATGVKIEHSQKRFLQDSLLVGRDLSPIVIERLKSEVEPIQKPR